MFILSHVIRLPCDAVEGGYLKRKGAWEKNVVDEGVGVC